MANSPSQQERKPNQSLIKYLQNSSEFRVHTGNVGSWGELKLRTFKDMSEELIECLRLQLAKWNPDEQTLKFGNNDFSLCTSQFCAAAYGIKNHSREDLRITLKVFLSEQPSAAWVKKCLMAFLKELEVNYVDQLIVALYPLNPDQNVQPSLSHQLLSLWPDLEKLVTEDGLCAALGTADLDVDDLERVWEGAKNIKPLVNHYNIVGCCAVPPELKEYADRKNIVLNTHNDPHPFLTTQQVQELFTDKLKVPIQLARMWTAKWAGRSTVFIKTRSVILSKGYVVHFQKKETNKKMCGTQ